MPYHGAGTFLIGLIMMIAREYLLLKGIMVRPQFGMGNQVFTIGGFPVTTGLVLVPLAFSISIGLFLRSLKGS